MLNYVHNRYYYCYSCIETLYALRYWNWRECACISACIYIYILHSYLCIVCIQTFQLLTIVETECLLDSDINYCYVENQLFPIPLKLSALPATFRIIDANNFLNSFSHWWQMKHIMFSIVLNQQWNVCRFTGGNNMFLIILGIFLNNYLDLQIQLK